MRATMDMQWQSPSPRGKLFGLLGITVVLGFIVTVGLLLQAVAQTQVVKDPKEGLSPLDVRSVTVKHDGERLITKIGLYKPTKLSSLSGGSRLWVAIHPGGETYYTMEMSKGPKGAITTLTRCNADRCAYEDAQPISGKQVNKRIFKMVVPRDAFAELGDRLEWQAGSVFGANNFDLAPDEGLKVHHL